MTRAVRWNCLCLDCDTTYATVTAEDEDPDTMDPVPLCPNCGSDLFDMAYDGEADIPALSEIEVDR